MNPMLIAGLAQIGGAAFGNYNASGDNKKMRRVIEDTDYEAGPTAFRNLQSDPEARNIQMRALEQLYARGAAGGMDPASRAALQQAQTSVNAANRGNQGAIVQNYATRGAGVGGSELAARLSSQQGSANANAAAGANAAGDASMRALEALSQAGGLAGTARGQTWGEQSDKAGAADVMARFNAGQRVKRAGMLAGMYESEADRKRKLGLGFGTSVGGMFAGGGGQ